MKVSLFHVASVAALLTLSLLSCTKDENSGSGTVNFEITDAPIDDVDIQGVFVTVADVRVDGQSIDNFSGKQTINLMAYQNGQVKGLGSGQLSAKSYTDVALVLDYDQDVNNASPGCYVLTKDGVKHGLKATANASNTLKIGSGSLKVTDQLNTTAVLDVNLRKAIKYGANGTGAAYQFVTDSELQSSVRLAAKARTGTIAGKCTDALSQSGSKIVVYAYKKGTYRDTEKQAQGESGIKFKNSVSSAVCDGDGNFALAFLEEGDYELHFVGYEDANNDGKMEEKGMLVLTILNALDLNALSLSAGATLQLNVTVTGIIP